MTLLRKIIEALSIGMKTLGIIIVIMIIIILKVEALIVFITKCVDF